MRSQRELVLASSVFVGASLVGCLAVSLSAAATPYVLVVLLAGVAALVTALAQAIRGEIDSRYRRVESLITIHSMIEPRRPLPMPRVYMASPEFLRAVTESVFTVRPDTIVELGSGVSTVVAAYALEKLGKGRIVSLDHEAQYADATNALLRAHGLEKVAKAVHAPLVDTKVGDRTSRWYDLACLAAEKVESVDLLIVDGPPGMDQALARYPAVPRLHDRLSAEAWVLVDDARRPDEIEMVRRWAAEHPELEVDAVPTEKGTTWLRRRRKV